MRYREIEKERILAAAIKLVADSGIENFTAKKAAHKCGISEGSVFSNFKNKEILLSESLHFIDAQLDEKLKEAQWTENDAFQNVKNLWEVYFRFLTENPQYAKFYNQYRHSSFYNRDIVKEQISTLKYFISRIQKTAIFQKYDYAVFWVSAIESTINFVTRIFDGFIENNDKNKQDFFNLLFNGVSFLFKE